MRRLLDAPYIDQTENWPTGCESVSAVMALNYLGVDISVDEFIRDHLPKQSMSFKDPQEMKPAAGGQSAATELICKEYDMIIGEGPDPDVHFAGSPYEEDSFGCYSGVIVKAMNSALRAADAPFEAFRADGADTAELMGSIDRGLPVIYWTSLDLKPTVTGPHWYLRGTDRLFTWISNEHCMLLAGYDTERDTLIFNDPWHAHGTVDISRELSEQRHGEQMQRAVMLKKL